MSDETERDFWRERRPRYDTTIRPDKNGFDVECLHCPYRKRDVPTYPEAQRLSWDHRCPPPDVVPGCGFGFS